MNSEQCWFCNNSAIEIWQNDSDNLPMCRLHAATTRAALKLREHGEDVLANELDEAVGIATKPPLVQWDDPRISYGRSFEHEIIHGTKTVGFYASYE